MRTRVTNPDILRRRFEMRFKDSYYRKVRNAGGKAFKFSKEARAVWRKIALAKTKPSFQRRAQEFVELLKRDAHANLTDKDWCRSLSYFNGGVSISKHRGSISSTPVVTLVDSLPGAYGDYTLHVLAGKHEIRLLTNRGINEMKETFRHECLHYIDKMSSTPDEGHGHYWQIRLNKLAQTLKL